LRGSTGGGCCRRGPINRGTELLSLELAKLSPELLKVLFFVVFFGLPFLNVKVDVLLLILVLD
jgi:hypothetical protein